MSGKIELTLTFTSIAPLGSHEPCRTTRMLNHDIGMHYPEWDFGTPLGQHGLRSKPTLDSTQFETHLLQLSVSLELSQGRT